MSRNYEVLRQSTVTIVLPPNGTEEQGDTPQTEVAVVYMSAGLFDASSDDQAAKQACAKQLKEGLLEGAETVSYVAVSEGSFHHHTLAIKRDPQIGFVR